MKALELNRHIFAWLCICPDTSPAVRRFRTWITGGIIVVECLAGFVSVLFFIKNLTTDFKNCIFAIFQVAALFGVVYMWFVGYMLREKINEIFSMFQQIYDLSEWFLFKLLCWNICFIICCLCVFISVFRPSDAS